MPGPDLLDPRKRREELIPLAILQASGLPIALPSRRRREHEHVGVGRGEKPGLSLYRGELRVARLWVMEHGGNEAPDQLEPVVREQVGHPFWFSWQEALGTSLECSEAE